MFAGGGDCDVSGRANPEPDHRSAGMFRLPKPIAVEILHRPCVLLAELRGVEPKEERVEPFASRSLPVKSIAHERVGDGTRCASAIRMRARSRAISAPSTRRPKGRRR